MVTKKLKVIKIEGKKGPWKTLNKENGEVKQTERQPNVKRGLAVIAVVGIGMCVYGYKLGHGIGYSRGAKDGVMYAVSQMTNVVNELVKGQKVV